MLELGEGPVILLVHGTGRSVADWQEGFAERLARCYRVVAFDYYGHGLSDRDHGLGIGFPRGRVRSSTCWTRWRSSASGTTLWTGPSSRTSRSTRARSTRWRRTRSAAASPSARSSASSATPRCSRRAATRASPTTRSSRSCAPRPGATTDLATSWRQGFRNRNRDAARTCGWALLDSNQGEGEKEEGFQLVTRADSGLATSWRQTAPLESRRSTHPF